MAPARALSLLMTVASLLLFSLPIAWTVYLAFFDPLSVVNVMGKPVPAGGLVAWLP